MEFLRSNLAEEACGWALRQTEPNSCPPLPAPTSFSDCRTLGVPSCPMRRHSDLEGLSESPAERPCGQAPETQAEPAASDLESAARSAPRPRRTLQQGLGAPTPLASGVGQQGSVSRAPPLGKCADWLVMPAGGSLGAGHACHTVPPAPGALSSGVFAHA